MAAGMQLDLEQMIPAFRGGKQTIVERSEFGFGIGAIGSNETLVELGITHKVVFEMALGCRWHVGDHCPVYLLEVALLHHLIHAREGFAGFCKKDYPAHRSVEAMDDATKNIAGFAVALLDIGLEEVGHAGVASDIGLDNLSRLFVDSYQVVVLI